jgi:hypothetical protein
MELDNVSKEGVVEIIGRCNSIYVSKERGCEEHSNI